MDIKKILAIGASVATLSMVAACSDDPPSSPNNPGSSASNGVTSSGSNSALISSSSVSDSDEPQMACSEIMYNYAKGDTLEWVEVYIAGGKNMDDMQNYNLHLSGDVDFVFPAEPLSKGEYVVVTNNVSAFKTAYPAFAGRVFGPMTGKMVNEGGVVNVKVRGEGDVTCAFSSEPPWPSLADGNGHSLVYTGGIAAQSTSWCVSAIPGGNPGVGDDECLDVVNTVRINEVKPSGMVAGGFDYGWLELYNSGTQDVDVSGWNLYIKLSDKTLKINAGSVVPAGGYLVLDGATAFDTTMVVSSLGGEIYLKGPVEGQEASIWLPAGTGVSGMVDVADGSIAQGPLATETKGAANSALKLGSVYINEIHYNPKSNDPATPPFEFLELANATEAPITLFSEQKGWKIEGINMVFNGIAKIPANGLILLIPEELEEEETSIPASQWGAEYVRSTYKIPTEVDIYTYKGKLSNRGETIAVKEPFKVTKKDGSTEEKIYYTWHDATLYSDAWAGLTEADGYGYSLHRADLSTMGYGPKAWKAALPTPGVK